MNPNEFFCDFDWRCNLATTRVEYAFPNSDSLLFSTNKQKDLELFSDESVARWRPNVEAELRDCLKTKPLILLD